MWVCSEFMDRGELGNCFERCSVHQCSILTCKAVGVHLPLSRVSSWRWALLPLITYGGAQLIILEVGLTWREIYPVLLIDSAGGPNCRVVGAEPLYLKHQRLLAKPHRENNEPE